MNKLGYACTVRNKQKFLEISTTFRHVVINARFVSFCEYNEEYSISNIFWQFVKKLEAWDYLLRGNSVGYFQIIN